MTITKQQRDKIVSEALEVRKKAYAPYSKYAVGAALLTQEGNIYRGVNVENAAYPTSMCAERAAVFSAVAGGERSITAIAVASANGGAPCGACRQVLSEFGLDTLVLVVDEQGQVVIEKTVAELLPDAFTPADLVS
jgi:cytidine deaminase